MDDLRLEWLGKKINLALGLNNNSVFEEFLFSGTNEEDLSRFLSTPNTSDNNKSVFFFTEKKNVEVEEEIEVVVGKFF